MTTDQRSFPYPDPPSTAPDMDDDPAGRRGRRGNCYVTTEALYHLLGGRTSGWVPQFLRHEGDTHWYLRHERTGVIVDATASQFRQPPDYSKGRGRPFLTRLPSARALALMERLVWQDDLLSAGRPQEEP